MLSPRKPCKYHLLLFDMRLCLRHVDTGMVWLLPVYKACSTFLVLSVLLRARGPLIHVWYNTLGHNKLPAVAAVATYHNGYSLGEHAGLLSKV